MKSGSRTFTSDHKQPPAGRAAADAIAIEALSFVADKPDRIRRFLDLTGLTPASLRQSASAPGFLAAVLDHITSDPALLQAFADRSGHAAAAIEAARLALAGAAPWSSE